MVFYRNHPSATVQDENFWVDISASVVGEIDGCLIF